VALALAISALGLAPGGAFAVSQTGHVSAGIWALITVTENNGMSFGTIKPPVAGGNVVLSTAGTISPAPGFFFAGTPTAGAFNAHGLAHFPAVVSFSTGDTLTGPGTAMALGKFTSNAAANFDGKGNLNFNVGATLTINANQAPGNYAGTYTVTVNF
jgi:hypothetical protein